MYMEDGKVAEYGPMQELLKKKGAFWRYHKQIDVVWLDQHGGAGVKPTGLLQVKTSASWSARACVACSVCLRFLFRRSILRPR